MIVSALPASAGISSPLNPDELASLQLMREEEKLDIADLDKSIPATDNQDLVRLYENLRAASYRHLNAYQRGLRRVSESPEKAEARAMHAIRPVLNSAS